MTHEIIPPSHAEGPAAEGSFVPPRVTDLTTTQTMRVLADCNRPFGDTADDMLLELHNALVTDTDCQKMLFTQVHSLNAFYNRLLSRAVDSKSLDGQPTLHVSDRMTILALQAQKQCLQTIAALTAIRIIEKNAVQTEGGK